jgi:hypothetical protein
MALVTSPGFWHPYLSSVAELPVPEWVLLILNRTDSGKGIVFHFGTELSGYQAVQHSGKKLYDGEVRVKYTHVCTVAQYGAAQLRVCRVAQKGAT